MPNGESSLTVRTRQLLVSGREKPGTSPGEHAVAGATDVREKAKGTVPCSDVRFRLMCRTNSGRSRVAGVVPGAWKSHPGDSKTRDPESAASTSGRTAQAVRPADAGQGSPATARGLRVVPPTVNRNRFGGNGQHEEESRDG